MARKERLKDALCEAANRVWETWMKYGPVDDGRPEGDDFDTALMELRLAAKRFRIQATEERKALVNIVNAASGTGNLDEAIRHAAAVIQASDLIDTGD